MEAAGVVHPQPEDHSVVDQTKPTDDDNHQNSEDGDQTPNEVSTGNDNSPPENQNVQQQEQHVPPTPTTATTPSITQPTSPSTPRRHKQSASREIPPSSIAATYIFITRTLKTIVASKDARRNPDLEKSAQKALDLLNADPSNLPPPPVLLEPLRLACCGNSIENKLSALDCFSKMLSFSLLADGGSPDSSTTPAESDTGIVPPPQVPVLDKAINIICECYQNTAYDERVELQIIKALMAGALNENAQVHGKPLIELIRTIYHIFIRSGSNANQLVAQASLQQVVEAIFERVRKLLPEPQSPSSSSHNLTRATLLGNSSSPPSPSTNPADDDNNNSNNNSNNNNNENNTVERVTLKALDDNGGSAMEEDRPYDDNAASNLDKAGSTNQLCINDAYLAYRALCKLTLKQLDSESQNDIKSSGMRSKLISLRMVFLVLENYRDVFASNAIHIKHRDSDQETVFVRAISPFICACLARNAASPVIPIFELCCEIFWIAVSELRENLKQEVAVFLNEIYLPILEMKTSPPAQKMHLLRILKRICADPKCLVEIYLNYDCDQSQSNVYEKLVDYCSKIATTQVSITAQQKQAFQEQYQVQDPSIRPPLSLPSLSVQAIANANFSHNEYPFPTEYILKHDALETMVAILNTLSAWADQASITTTAAPSSTTATADGQASSSSTNADGELTPQSSRSLSTATLSPSLDSSMTKFSGGQAKRDSNPLVDDPSQFESLKHTKTVLTDGIRKFNFKPSRGIKALIDNGFIKSKSPNDIASFLLSTPGIDKNVFGEFIGEGNDENIEIMHAVVDNIDFKKMDFLDALRKLLRAFRLPGESQKIDRILLKFAEHYYSQNPDAPFANGDTVYVLAYSVIMLNTDLHNPQVKIKMTTDDFIRNNRGINDNGDLPKEFLLAIYNDVRDNEFILDDHHRVESIESGGYGLTSISNILSSFGRDIQREAYLQVSRDMSTKTEAMFKDIAGNKTSRTKTSNVFYIASHAEHAGPMFEVGWMSFLGGLSGLMQESDDISIAHICMDGIKTAIHLSCLFDIEYARISFVAALAAFTNLQNLNELKLKNVEAIKVLLEVALSEGNFLKSSWKEVLTCISQLERFQLISSGINEGSVPDVTMARIARRRSSESTTRSRQSFSWARTTRMLTNSGNSGTGIGSSGNSNSNGNNSGGGGNTLFGLHNNSVPKFAEDVAMESKSSEIEVLMDRIFTQSASLNGDAIIFFVKALTQVSWEEIESSGQSDSPRMFSLQKMVDVSYYNMNRIRVEWSNLWAIMGEQFNQVGCHSNVNVVFFALDSLRQLSIRFLELEELSHFKFQKDFLRPFEHVMMNNPSMPVKDMVIACLHQMILAKANKIKSGWRTMFGTFASAAKEHNQQLVNTTFQVVSLIHRDHLSEVIAQGSFADMIVALTALSKNHWYQKPSLHAIELLKSSINAIMENPECPLSPKFKHPKTQSPDDAMIKFWFPILFAFHDIIMTGEDLEVRSRALNYFFDTLVQYGNTFSPEFWDTVCRQLLFPIFVVLKSKSDVTKFNSKEDMSVWLSTTMIQALRNFIALFSFYFDILEKMMDTFLDLLVSCICQENETLAHLGTSCLLQLVNDNYSKFQKKHWDKIVDTFRRLFQITTATQLFDGRDRHVSNGLGPGTPTNGENNNRSLQQVSRDQNGVEAASAGAAPGGVSAARRREFATIIVKCVLQLLMIDTLRELLTSKKVYQAMPCDDMLTLLGLLMDSFTFARKFNNDKDLRVALWHEGFMRQLPNLLMQESKAASTRVAILFDMYCDESPEKQAVRDKVETMLIEIIIDILEGYTALETGTQQRNIAAWHPVVVDILTRYTALSPSDYGRHIDAIYPVTIDLLDRDLDRDLRSVLKSFLVKAGDVLMKK